MGKESHYSSKKDRVFVRAIAGQYSLKEELHAPALRPRVIKGKDLLFNDGPQSFSKHFIEPEDGLAQTLHIHLEEYGPGGRTQKHGHVNEARSTSSTARATRSTTASATTGRRATSRSCT
jgi:hypothetical protein